MDNNDIKKSSKEIDIFSILMKVLQNRKTIFLSVLIFAALGIIVALASTKRYTTSVVLAPEVINSNMSGVLGSVNSMLGLSFSKSSGDAISPEIYPSVMTSTPFLIDLFDVPVTLKDGVVKSYSAHLAQDYKPAFWEYPKIYVLKLISLFKEKKGGGDGINPFHLTEKQSAICDLMKLNIQCVVDQSTSLITVNVRDIDEIVAATMADTVTSRLQEYIIEYRTKKARHDLEYITTLYNQAKDEYINVQAEYAKYSDASTNVVRSRYKIILDNLENEMLLKYNLYSEVAQQLQLAHQRVQERTPVFTVIQPATVSLKASSFSRVGIVLIFCVLGVCAGIAWSMFLKFAFFRYWVGIRKINKKQ